MSDFCQRWLETAERKQSVLCVGIDAAEPGQRQGLALGPGMSKLQWTLDMIEKVAPYAAAIKINRNYYKDISRQAMQDITACIRSHGMLSIDDCKLADIGATNETGIYHAKVEGYDALTFAPFAGNTAEAAQQAREAGIGLICLVLMSNPEFAQMKEARIHGLPFHMHLAEQAAAAGVDAVVIGAPSPHNHIKAQEIAELAERLPHAAVLVPGIGAQGGDAGPILSVFGPRTIANVGRAIIYADNPAAVAKESRDSLMQKLAEF